MMGPRADVRLRHGHGARVKHGYPWIFSNEIEMDAEAKAIPAGSVVRVLAPSGAALACATFNSHSLISARILSPNPDASIDTTFVGARLKAAIALRARLGDASYCRLVHAEADGLPGLALDRYGDVFVCQVNTAGMERLIPDVVGALDELFSPRAVVLRADSRVRELEGLSTYVSVAAGAIDEAVTVREAGLTFPVDPIAGQKTGWFYDQRDNRAFVAALAKDSKVIDVYCHTGAFGLTALAAGARAAVFVESSQTCLDQAARTAESQGVADRCAFVRADGFDEMGRRAGEKFDIVIADPPAFVGSRKSLKSGLRGYRKMTRLAATLVAPGGLLVVASCSHLVTVDEFAHQVARGLADAGRRGRVLRAADAPADHPRDAALPETAYLKCLTLQLD